MTGIEVAVGVLFAWAVRKARRVAGRVDAEADRALDAGMDRVHELVSRALGDNDPVLTRLGEEARAGLDQPSERTRQRLALALEDAGDQDPGFADALARAVAQVQQVQQVQAASGHSGIGHLVTGATFHGPAALQVGDHNQQTNTFGS